MTIVLNDSTYEVDPNNCHLISLMKIHELYHESGIAVAINEEIMPRHTWEQYQVKDNDNILIITATQGG